MNNLTILVVSFISFVFGILFMFMINLCFNSYCDNKKYKPKYSYEKTYEQIDKPVIYPISNQKITSENNNLSALDILESNKKQFAALFIICLFVGFYCGNVLLQVQMHH